MPKEAANKERLSKSKETLCTEETSKVKSKFDLLDDTQVAEFAVEEGLTQGYRQQLSYKDCFLSIFWLHNESVNIWSHGVGFIIFSYQLGILLLECYTTASNNYDVNNTGSASFKVSSQDSTKTFQTFEKPSGTVNLDSKTDQEDSSTSLIRSSVILSDSSLKHLLLDYPLYFTSYYLTPMLQYVTAADDVDVSIFNVLDILKTSKLGLCSSCLFKNLPFLIQLISYQMCMLLSTLFHTFSCHSEEVHNVWLERDHLSIVFALFGTYISYAHFSFHCDLTWYVLHITLVILVFSTFGIHFHTCKRSKVRQLREAKAIKLRQKMSENNDCIDDSSSNESDLNNSVVEEEIVVIPKMRINLKIFILLALYALIPITHWFHMLKDEDVNVQFIHNRLKGILIPYLYTVVGISFFKSRFPEKFCSRKFLNLFGASHQIWHFAVLFGMLVWFNEALMDKNFRDFQQSLIYKQNLENATSSVSSTTSYQCSTFPQTKSDLVYFQLHES